MTTDTAVHKLMCGAPMSTPLTFTCASARHFMVDNSVDDDLNRLCAAHKAKDRAGDLW